MIAGIDPGTYKSALVVLEADGAVYASDTMENAGLLVYLRTAPVKPVIEMVENQGRMAVGKDTFETCVWIGRFIEAAQMDARNAWQRFWHVILPMIRPAVVIVVIFRTMIALRAFAAIFSATGGGPGTATEILNRYTYRESFNSLNLGYGAALGTALLAITVVISMIFFRMRQSRM